MQPVSTVPNAMDLAMVVPLATHGQIGPVQDFAGLLASIASPGSAQPLVQTLPPPLIMTTAEPAIQAMPVAVPAAEVPAAEVPAAAMPKPGPPPVIDQNRREPILPPPYLAGPVETNPAPTPSPTLESYAGEADQARTRPDRLRRAHERDASPPLAPPNGVAPALSNNDTIAAVEDRPAFDRKFQIRNQVVPGQPPDPQAARAVLPLMLRQPQNGSPTTTAGPVDAEPLIEDKPQPGAFTPREPSGNKQETAAGVTNGNQAPVAAALPPPPPEILPHADSMGTQEQGNTVTLSRSHVPLVKANTTETRPVEHAPAQEVRAAGSRAPDEPKVKEEPRTPGEPRALKEPISPGEPKIPLAPLDMLATQSASWQPPPATFQAAAAGVHNQLPPADARPDHGIAEQVAPVVVTLLRSSDDTHRLTIRLHPDALGQVDIRIDRPVDAPARITVTAERPETLTILEQDRPRLEHALNLAGLSLDANSLRFDTAAQDTAAALPQSGMSAQSGDQGSARPGGQNAGQNTGQNTGQQWGQPATPGRHDTDGNGRFDPGSQAFFRPVRAGIDIMA